jgi:hypothetical protein
MGAAGSHLRKKRGAIIRGYDRWHPRNLEWRARCGSGQAAWPADKDGMTL